MTFELFSSYLNRDTVTKVHVHEKIRINLPTIYICTPDMVHNLQAYGNCDSPHSESYNNVSCPNLEYECPDFCENGMCENLDKKEKFSITCPKNLYGQCIAINAEGSVVQSFVTAWSVFITRWSESEFNMEMYVRPPGFNDTLISLVYDPNWKDLKRPGEYLVYIESTKVTHLPPPYSDCVTEDEEEDGGKNIIIVKGAAMKKFGGI